VSSTIIRDQSVSNLHHQNTNSRCIAVGERAAQAPLKDRKNLSGKGKASLTLQCGIHATQEDITMQMKFMTSAE
jgi:hypothetical protein